MNPAPAVVCVNAVIVAVVAILVLPFIGLPSVAQAGERTRLAVTRDRGAEECPDERALRDAVGARLGYEPFASNAPSLVAVTFRREGATLLGTVQLRDAAGKVKGERTLSSARGDCDELASTTTLTISILLDPRGGLTPPTRQPAERASVTATAPAIASTVESPAALPAASSEPFVWRLTADATGTVGSAPAATVGLLVGAGVEHRWWSASGEFRGDLPASRAVGAQEARTSFTGGSLVPCAHLGMGYACGVLSMGALRGEVVGASPSSHSTFHVMLGPRVGLSIPFGRWLSLDGHVDGSVALTRTTLHVPQNDVWTTPRMSGLVGIGMLGRFP